MSNRDIAVEYVHQFCNANIDGVEANLASNFQLRGPLFEFDSRNAYIASLRENPPEPAAYEILDVSESENTVSVYYSYEKSTGSIIIAQLFRFNGGKICETLLVFDSVGVI